MAILWIIKRSLNKVLKKTWDNFTLPLISSQSPLTSQWPTALDTPHIVTFGAAQWSASDPVQLLTDWTLKINQAWAYMIRLRAEFWRTLTWGTVNMLFRTTLDWVQIWQTTAVKLESKNVLIALDSYIPAATPQWEVRLEIMRDSSGANDWALFSTPATPWDWSDSPCANLQVFKVDQLI